MMIGGIQSKTFHIGFKRHSTSLKRRMVRLTKHGVANDSIFFSPGTVYLEEKTKPSQDLSTLSDVSVKSEVEDRKPGSSQLSDFFKASSSDTQVDSPRSKKNRCKEKNQDMTVNAQSEQKGSVTTPEQMDSYPHYRSSPAHPPPATPLYSPLPFLVGSIACVKCRDRKVKVCLFGLSLNRLLSFSSFKCIPAPHEEPPRCTRCKEKNQPCQYMTVTAQSEQRGRATTPEQTDYYPYYGSGPVHPPPAPPSQPPPLDSTYSYPQQPFSNQSYPTSAYQNPDHQNTPALSFTPPSNMASAFQTANHQNAPFVSFFPPSNMSSVHQALSHAPPRQAFPYAQPSEAKSTHQMPPE